MPPTDPRRSRPQVPKRTYLRPAVSDDRQLTARQQAARDAAAGVVRGQIQNLFQQNAQTAASYAYQASDDPSHPPQSSNFTETSHSSTDSPYNRTHQPNRTNLETGHWEKYHSAWQDYYKQYYERFYLGEIYKLQQSQVNALSANEAAVPQDTPFASLADNHDKFDSLKADLLGNVRQSALNARQSKHFMPFVAAGLAMFMFLFLQYNRVLIANVEAYVSPGSINPANIIVDPNISIPVSQEPRLIIPKINVDVPVVYDVKPDQASQLKAMERGVAWFGIPGANSRPGQVGNTVLSGHSSNDLFDPGDYKFIFAKLEQLTEGDTFYVNYLGTRYTYSITKREVVKPTDVHKLVYPTDKPVMTLITCVPLGTAQNRLLVTAEQISPDPMKAQQAPAQKEAAEKPAMPGNSPNLLNRLFGG